MLGTLFGIVGNSNLLRGNLVFGDSGGISFSNGGRDGGGGGGVCVLDFVLLENFFTIIRKV